MKYRKKPVVIEAMRFLGRPFSHTEMCIQWDGFEKVSAYNPILNQILIETLEGTHYALPGDWIIRGIKGEFYPCKPDIFEATYEPVD